MFWACRRGVFLSLVGAVFRIRCAVGGPGRRARACEGVSGRVGACRVIAGPGLVGVAVLVSVVVVGGEQGFGGGPVVGESYGGAPRGACDACWGVPELPAQFFG